MKRGTPRHPKVSHLCELLKIRLAMAIGYLELLWHFTAEFAPQGDVGKFSDERIEAGVTWHGASGKLVSALTESGWLDQNRIHRLVVHHWHDHADDAVRKKLHRAGLQFLSITQKVTGHRPTTADNGCLPEPSLARALPEPEPEPPPARLSSPSPSDLNHATSPHFEEFWGRWCDGTGLVQNRDAAARAWLSVVRAGDEEAVAACLESYVSSPPVSGGYVKTPDKWLFEQAKQRWIGRWPAQRAAQSKQQQNAEGWKHA